MDYYCPYRRYLNLNTAICEAPESVGICPPFENQHNFESKECKSNMNEFGNDFGFASQGWQCPLCGRVYSPYTSRCFYCNNTNNTYATTDTNLPTIFDKMKDLSKEEQEEYCKVLNTLYKDTGLNINELITEKPLKEREENA